MTPIGNILSETATFILAGGRGERLRPLTERRSKPAVPFGDRRIIDFVLQNCLKSGLTHPFVITQYQSTHLAEHVRRWWLGQSANGADATAAPVCVPPSPRNYSATADALFRNLHALNAHTNYVIVLSADHIYEMDYRELLQFHFQRAADTTLGAIVCRSESSKQFGILEVDELDRVVGFEEKPMYPAELPGQAGKVLANMGVYVFRKDVFVDALQADARDSTSLHDIGRNIIPKLVAARDVHAYRFKDRKTGQPRYWKDVGTIESYYNAVLECHRRTRSGSFIAKGVDVHPTAEIVDSILLPGVRVGAGARIRRAILDENVRVMPGAQIGCGMEGGEFHWSSNGITVITGNTVIFANEARKRLANPPQPWTVTAFGRD